MSRSTMLTPSMRRQTAILPCMVVLILEQTIVNTIMFSIFPAGKDAIVINSINTTSNNSNISNSNNKNSSSGNYIDSLKDIESEKDSNDMKKGDNNERKVSSSYTVSTTNNDDHILCDNSGTFNGTNNANSSTLCHENPNHNASDKEHDDNTKGESSPAAQTLVTDKYRSNNTWNSSDNNSMKNNTIGNGNINNFNGTNDNDTSTFSGFVETRSTKDNSNVDTSSIQSVSVDGNRKSSSSSTRAGKSSIQQISKSTTGVTSGHTKPGVRPLFDQGQMERVSHQVQQQLLAFLTSR